MKNILIAAALTVIAIGVASTAKRPGFENTVNPYALAQARAAIAELPLPGNTKESFFTRIERAPEAHLPYLVEEARRAVDSPTNARGHL